MEILDEDDAAERQRPLLHRHRHRHRQGHGHGHGHRPGTTLETVINGTTWYHLQASSARYDPFSADAPAGAHPPFQRQPHPAYFHDMAFESMRIGPQFPVVPPPFGNAVPDHAHGARYGGVFPGHPHPGMSSMCGSVLGYPCNVQQNQRMPYLWHARPHMPPANPSYVSFPDPSGASQEPFMSSGGQFVLENALHGRAVLENMSHGLPPHAIRTAGKTMRQIVTWSGMTMPVTVTSQAAAIVEWIQRQAGELFGFDLEWKPNRCKEEDNAVALLQMCGPTDCLIIQLLYADAIPIMLRDFLSNTKKQLGGVGIRQDVAKLERDHDLVCQGQVELGPLASEKLQRSELQATGLKMLVYQVLGMTLLKSKKITLSNWEKEDLDDKQIEYACIDAWAAYAVLHKLMTL